MTALRSSTVDGDTDESLEAVVARIKASGRGRVLPVPSAEAVRRFIAEVALEAPMDQAEEKAWNETWAHIVDDMHRRDREDDIAEGRG